MTQNELLERKRKYLIKFFEGWPLRHVAKSCGVSHVTVWKIWKGKSTGKKVLDRMLENCGQDQEA